MTVGELCTAYQRLVTARGYEIDTAQTWAVTQLEDLRRRLILANTKSTGWRSWLPGAAHTSGYINGIYLWGPVGRGKTWLMDLFFDSLPFQQRRRQHFHRFMQEVHAELATLKHTVAPLQQVATRIANQARVLCFDELHVTDIADAMIIGGLFSALVEQDVTLVITSNSAPEDLYKDGLQRQRFLPAIALLRQRTQVVHVAGAVDHRLRQLTQAVTYFDATAIQTSQQMTAMFTQLCGGNAPQPTPLRVNDRDINTLGLALNCVWFDFETLCDGPRASGDYIEIARLYQTVLVSDIPYLDTENDNAVRRFIILIDEFYDRNVKLIVSAAAAPALLYRGERLRKEFARTVSRLMEMQSTQYLSRMHLS